MGPFGTLAFLPTPGFWRTRWPKNANIWHKVLPRNPSLPDKSRRLAYHLLLEFRPEFFLYLAIMPKLARPLVILIAAIAIAYLWWHDDTSHRVVPAIESVIGVSPVEPTPVQMGELKFGSDAINGDGDIDAAQSIDSAEGVSVQGWVKDQLGQSISGMQIEISPKHPSAWQQIVYTASTDHRGEFLFGAIPPDNEYRLEVLASGSYAGTLLDPFPVSRDMPAATISLDSLELVTVDGMIVNVDDGPVTDFEILVQNVSIAYPGRKIISDMSGFFQLAKFPAGELQLSTSGAEHFKITGITLRPGEYRNLTLALDKGSYHLSGWVSDEFDAPIAQARVVLTSAFSREDYHSSSYRFMVTDSNGGFAFSGLGGQDHQLSADAIGYETQVLNYRFQSFSDNLNIRLQRK